MQDSKQLASFPGLPCF